MSKVLIVDDEEDICELLKDLLVNWGHTVEMAKDGVTALRIMAEKKPNVIFLDRRMPGIDGQEVMKKMRENKIESHVIVMTADVDDQAHEEMKALGAVGVITKPFEILKLKDQLGEMLPLIFRN